MKILVAYGSNRGGTAGIAERIVDSLRASGFEAEVARAHEVRSLRNYDAVIVGGGLYAGAWVEEARRFVLRHYEALRRVPVFFFSSGPLDTSAQRADIPPTPQVDELFDYVGARDHVTFGGRLAPDARGFIAGSMAKRRSGDWRDADSIRRWAEQVAGSLRTDGAAARRPASSFKPLPSRAAVVALCMLAGLTAIGGGAALVARPDGSLVRLPLRVLAHSPFHDFLVPGLVLALVVGVSNTLSAILHLARRRAAPVASTAAGSTLVGWIVVEMILLRSAEPLQLAYLVLGLAIVRSSLRDLAARFRAPGPRAMPGAPKPVEQP